MKNGFSHWRSIPKFDNDRRHLSERQCQHKYHLTPFSGSDMSIDPMQQTCPTFRTGCRHVRLELTLRLEPQQKTWIRKYRWGRSMRWSRRRWLDLDLDLGRCSREGGQWSLASEALVRIELHRVRLSPEAKERCKCRFTNVWMAVSDGNLRWFL